jgi:hypothetical protein
MNLITHATGYRTPEGQVLMMLPKNTTFDLFLANFLSLLDISLKQMFNIRIESRTEIGGVWELTNSMELSDTREIASNLDTR